MNQQKRCVLVTGSAGYVGSQTVLELKAAGFRVVGVDDLSNGDPEAMTLADHSVRADIRDRNAMETVFRGEAVAGIVHCAALAVVADSVRDPLRYFRSNVEGTVALLEAAARHGRPPVVFSSSATVYGAPDQSPIAETTPRLPIHPYGFTKLSGERALEFADRAHGLRSVSLRYFNAAGADHAARIGERHRVETRVLPNLIRAALGAGRVSPFSLAGDDYPTEDGTCVRDFVHTKDIARAHLASLEYLWSGGRTDALNIGGGGDGTSVRALIRAVEHDLGRPVPVEVGPRRPGDAPVLVADIRRAGAVLGWQPLHSSIAEIVRTARVWHEAEAARGLISVG